MKGNGGSVQKEGASVIVDGLLTGASTSGLKKKWVEKMNPVYNQNLQKVISSQTEVRRRNPESRGEEASEAGRNTIPSTEGSEPSAGKKEFESTGQSREKYELSPSGIKEIEFKGKKQINRKKIGYVPKENSRHHESSPEPASSTSIEPTPASGGPGANEWVFPGKNNEIKGQQK